MIVFGGSLRVREAKPGMTLPWSSLGYNTWRERASMELRFYEDPETGMPHIYGHGVTEEEARQILARPVESLKLEDDKRMALGKTFGGRHLCVVYVPDPEPDSVFVITAYEMRDKFLKAYRRRQRRRGP
jgi:hypothetical protein